MREIAPREIAAREIAEGYREFAKATKSSEFDAEDVALWHFPMMNDGVRNDAYDKALGAAIKAKSTEKKAASVLEIGTGSGLLALMAARHGASRVVTYEGVPVIARKAVKIIEQNGYADRIQVVEGLSTNVKVALELAERFDVLVTEIFDDGLLGEGAFKAIKHAKEYLLKPAAQIIPARVRVMMMGIESQEIYDNYRVGTISGFDVRAFNEFGLQDYVGIHLDKMKYRAISKPTPVFDFDFSNLPGKQSISLDLDIVEGGFLHAIVYWFELSMDENTVVSSGPGLAKLSSWKQAVQVAESAELRSKGEKVALTADHDENAIWFTPRESVNKIEEEVTRSQ